MGKVLEFINSNYLIFFIIGIFFLLALIGYMYDKHQHRDFTVKEKKPKKGKKAKVEPKGQVQEPQQPAPAAAEQQVTQPVQASPEQQVQETPQSVQPVQPEPTPETTVPESEGMNMNIPMEDNNK